MNRQQIQMDIEQWAKSQNFTAPYGVLTGSHVNNRGTKYLSVTFGRARTLDATVEIYNRNFMILRTSRYGRQVCKSYNELKEFLNSL
jgi:hypothetical protein